jgi:hypothetical protein
MAHAVAAGIAGSRQEGMSGFVETFETALCYCLPEPGAELDAGEEHPVGLEAAWRSVQCERPVSRYLSAWRVPCLICDR